MSDPAGSWTARVTVRLPKDAWADWVERSLRPESQREVPRTRAELVRPDPRSVELAIKARDTGAARAALNTFLGWVDLSVATVRSAERRTTGTAVDGR